MAAAHRNTDLRACGATTVSSQGAKVYVNSLLWAINGDPDSEGDGQLIAAVNNVFIGGQMVVKNGNSASPDALCVPIGGAHCNPLASSGSSNVFVG